MSDYILRLRELVGGQELLQVASVSVALRDEQNRVLLARHSAHGKWLLPGGSIEPGEVPADAAVREMREETGLLVRLTRLVGVFGGPDFIVEYQSGHRTSYVMTVFEATNAEGNLCPDGIELLEVRFVAEPAWQVSMWPAWIPEVLRAVFHPTSQFQAPSEPCWP